MPSKSALIALGIILAIGLGLHLCRISYPDRPVFDEAHFATYAADYAKDKIFFDIHPPLGKLIYAAAIPLAHPGPLGDTDFVSFTNNPSGTVYYSTGIPFGSFPYVPLRLVGVFFGLLLAVAFYFFLRNIGISEVGALLGAFFVTFENTLLLETKLILMNGMYLAFGFIALALWFAKPRRPIAAGFLLGLSLGVKLIGVVFLGPILLSVIPGLRAHQSFNDGGTRNPDPGFRLGGRNDIKKFFVTVIFIFITISFLNFLFFSPNQILSFSRSIGIQFPAAHNARSTALLAYVATTIVPWAGYVIGGPQPQESVWYGWPFMHGTMFYYAAPSGVGSLVLKGNPVIWYGSTLAVAIGIIALLWQSQLLICLNEQLRKKWRTPLLLIVGYIFSLLPFVTFVRRGTFLYHYLPALLFAIGFLAWGISHLLKLEDFGSLTKRQWFYLAGIAALAIGGFIITAPFTYGW